MRVCVAEVKGPDITVHSELSLYADVLSCVVNYVIVIVVDEAGDEISNLRA